jgi:NAD(P)-dependent dehydrogenase (short-subunit alcohol dehydrogenase family)
MESNAKVVVITGASSGFGNLLANVLVQKGHRVFGTSRNPSATTSLPNVTMLPLDVCDDNSVSTCASTVLSETDNRLDVLINNAGYLLEGPLEEITLEQLKAQFETNFFGAVRMINAFLPTMRKQRSGHIINISSIAGLMALPFKGAYSASKFALEGYSESLRQELKPIGIHVSIIEPSYYKTNLSGNKQGSSGHITDYDPHRGRMFARVQAEWESAPGPEAVVETIAKAVESRSPKLRYPVGKFKVNYLFRRLVPESVYESGLRRYWKLDEVPKSEG